jgi:hypothetical protein
MESGRSGVALVSSPALQMGYQKLMYMPESI